jgi:hypothetical protein
MFDLSIFIKELKGGFAQWYNRRHGRYGVLWADRFKSVLLEGGEALAAVAAYIELNPVRASLCADPKDYRYCGYAEALAKGSSLARQGIRIVLGLSMFNCWSLPTANPTKKPCAIGSINSAIISSPFWITMASMRPIIWPNANCGPPLSLAKYPAATKLLTAPEPGKSSLRSQLLAPSAPPASSPALARHARGCKPMA